MDRFFNLGRGCRFCSLSLRCQKSSPTLLLSIRAFLFDLWTGVNVFFYAEKFQYPFITLVFNFRLLQLSSSSSCRIISTDIPDPLLPPFSIVHCFQQATSRISTQQLYAGSSWSSCLCSSMLRGPQEYFTYEFVPISTVCLVRVWFV